MIRKGPAGKQKPAGPACAHARMRLFALFFRMHRCDSIVIMMQVWYIDTSERYE